MGIVIYSNLRSNHFRFHSKTVTADNENAKTVTNKINVPDNNINKSSNSKVDATKQEGRTWSYL
jgi:hypothetical protein